MLTPGAWAPYPNVHLAQSKWTKAFPEGGLTFPGPSGHWQQSRVSSSHAGTVLSGTVISKRSSHLKNSTWKIKENGSLWKKACYEIILGELDSVLHRTQELVASGCSSRMSVGLASRPISALSVFWNRSNTFNNLWKVRLWSRIAVATEQGKEACMLMPQGQT